MCLSTFLTPMLTSAWLQNVPAPLPSSFHTVARVISPKQAWPRSPSWVKTFGKSVLLNFLVLLGSPQLCDRHLPKQPHLPPCSFLFYPFQHPLHLLKPQQPVPRDPACPFRPSLVNCASVTVFWVVPSRWCFSASRSPTSWWWGGRVRILKLDSLSLLPSSTAYWYFGLREVTELPCVLLSSCPYWE